MFEGVDAYPLSWPVGWPRFKSFYRTDGLFAEHSLAEARDFVMEQLRISKASTPIFSTNVMLRKDGLPRSGQRDPEDPGAAVYFALKGQPRVMACDKWKSVAGNLWAIGLTIQAIRKQQRWGVGSLEQVFQGFAYLPAPKTWWEILKVPFRAERETVKAAYVRMVKQAHPDAGGSHEAFIQVQQAWERACKERGWA